MTPFSKFKNIFSIEFIFYGFEIMHLAQWLWRDASE